MSSRSYKPASLTMRPRRPSIVRSSSASSTKSRDCPSPLSNSSTAGSPSEVSHYSTGLGSPIGMLIQAWLRFPAATYARLITWFLHVILTTAILQILNLKEVAPLLSKSLQNERVAKRIHLRRQSRCRREEINQGKQIFALIPVVTDALFTND